MDHLRYALRVLAKAPSFTAIAVLTLALGVGVNSGIFSIVDAVVLRPLPYPQPERLVSLWTRSLPNQPQNMRSSGDTLGGTPNDRFTISPANLVDYRKSTRVFTGMAGFAFAGRNLTESGPPERLFGEKVTADYFQVLGVGPAIGRAFLPQEQQPGNDRVVIITNELWHRRFGGDAGLLGREIMLDQQNCRVIGIMAPGFKSPTQFVVPEELSFFVPAAYSPAQLADRSTAELNVIARLKPGATIRQAQDEMDAISTGLEQQFPATNKNIRLGMDLLGTDIASTVRTSMLVLSGAVGLILLIACANLANLLLARGVGRQREIAIRFALGARRGQIIRELFTQSAALAAFGFIAGLALGGWTTQLLVRFAPADIPRLGTAGVDARVIAFTALLSIATAILFGLFPAIQATRSGPSTTLKASERGVAAPGVMRSRNLLMVAEISLSMMLLVGAGLLLRSFLLMNGVDVGYETHSVVAMNVNLPPANYPTADQRFAFFDDLAARVAALPGVESTAFANRLPLRGGWNTSVQLDDKLDQRNAEGQAVSTGYFQTLEIPLLRGRLFTQQDRRNAPRVAIVNAAFARAYLGGHDATGHQLRLGPNMPATIIGMVADVHRGGKASRAAPQVYFPAAQTDTYPVRLADFAFRAGGDPKALVAAVRRQVWAIDKDQPVTRVGRLDDLVSEAAAPRRFETLLIGLFAALALTLALVGIYGVVSYSVSQRTGEIGLRLALGANRGNILRMVVLRSLILIAAGIVTGAAAAYGLSRYLAALLFEVRPYDPATYATIAFLLSTVAVAACLVPARRAMKIDPMVALRYER
ncbi:MAG TPA: ABC transporter permease [Bryobacteraceae bacterium]|nr:ABC transporter permease [Bryobacteraceae bacterium]